MSSYWLRPETVERFAAKKPDKRMIALLKELPQNSKVLDLGCAAGRNTVYLAEKAMDYYAIDSSEMMLAKTKQRIAEISGEAEANKRVLNMNMTALGFDDASFDLIIALGVIHDAQTEEDWRTAIKETARVLKKGGKLLIAHFSPDSNPHGSGIKLLEGSKQLYSGFAPKRAINLIDCQGLDSYLLEHKLTPIQKTYSVKRDTPKGYRTTVNGLYEKY